MAFSLEDLLDAFSGKDKVRKLFDSETVESILPLIIDQYHVIKPKSLIGHVQEPHAHCARPHHQANKLFQRNISIFIPRNINETKKKKKKKLYQIDLEEESPIRESFSANITRFTSHEICVFFFFFFEVI